MKITVKEPKKCEGASDDFAKSGIVYSQVKGVLNSNQVWEEIGVDIDDLWGHEWVGLMASPDEGEDWDEWAANLMAPYKEFFEYRLIVPEKDEPDFKVLQIRTTANFCRNRRSSEMMGKLADSLAPYYVAM